MTLISIIDKWKLSIWKYMEILEKVRNIVKNNFDTELIYSKNNLKAEKKGKYKTRLPMFLCTSNID